MIGAKKSEHNPCPICGLPRGKGPHEFAHGKCIEARAKIDGKKSAGLAVLAKRDSARHADVEDTVQSGRPAKRQPALGASDG